MSENVDGDVHLLVKLSTKVLQFIHKYQLVVESWPIVPKLTKESLKHDWNLSVFTES